MTISPLNRQPQVVHVYKNAFHPTIILKLSMALRAFHLANLWFNNTRTEWAFDVAFRFGPGAHGLHRQVQKNVLSVIDIDCYVGTP